MKGIGVVLSESKLISSTKGLGCQSTCKDFLSQLSNTGTCSSTCHMGILPRIRLIGSTFDVAQQFMGQFQFSACLAAWHWLRWQQGGHWLSMVGSEPHLVRCGAVLGADDRQAVSAPCNGCTPGARFGP